MNRNAEEEVVNRNWEADLVEIEKHLRQSAPVLAVRCDTFPRSWRPPWQRPLLVLTVMVALVGGCALAADRRSLPSHDCLHRAAASSAPASAPGRPCGSL